MSASYRFAKSWLACAAACMLLSCGGGGGSDDDSGRLEANDAVSAANSTVPRNVFTAALNSVQEVPQNSSTATGIGVVVVNPASRLMRATLTTAGIAGISADIRIAQPGNDGSPVFPLTEASAGSGIWAVQTTLTDEQLASLRNGDFAFTVRSAAFQEGEISGQILSQLPGSGLTNPNDGTEVTVNDIDGGNIVDGGTTITNGDGSGRVDDGIVNDAPFAGTITRRTTFVNVLTGTQQVPARTTDATAIGVAILDPSSGSMVASITSIGISGTAAHIHRAPAGSNGDMLFMLNETALGSGIWAARLALSSAQINTFADGNNYFDIHTAAFPNGAIRGQIVASSATGNFGTGTGSSGVTTGGVGAGVVPGGSANLPFTPAPVTDTGDNGSIQPGGSSVPSLGNPIGSGIGGAGSNGFTGTGVPTFGNPVGSGIGAEPSTGFGTPSLPPSAAIGTGTGFTGTAGNSGGFTITAVNVSGTNGLITSRF